MTPEQTGLSLILLGLVYVLWTDFSPYFFITTPSLPDSPNAYSLKNQRCCSAKQLRDCRNYPKRPNPRNSTGYCEFWTIATTYSAFTHKISTLSRRRLGLRLGFLSWVPNRLDVHPTKGRVLLLSLFRWKHLLLSLCATNLSNRDYHHRGPRLQSAYLCMALSSKCTAWPARNHIPCAITWIRWSPGDVLSVLSVLLLSKHGG